MVNYKEQKRIYLAVFYLISVILRENLILVIGLLIFSTVLWIPTCVVLAKDGGGSATGFIMFSTMFMPLMLASTILIPTIHQQISSSSISMRMRSSGLPFRIYGISMILFFTILFLVIFYIVMLPLYIIFFNQIVQVSSDFIQDPISGDWVETFFDIYQYQMTFSLVNTIFLVPITMLGLVSFGFFLGNIKINEIVKGILILLFIVLFLINQLSFDPLWKIKDNIENPSAIDLPTKKFIESRVRLFHILTLNPLGTIAFTMNTSVNSVIYTNVQYDYSMVDVGLKAVGTSTSSLIIQAQVAGALYSFGFFGLAVFTSK